MHTGAHKLNNALGQAVLAQRLGKTRIIAETGAGQHGVATATVCARFGLECVVYMGSEDMRRQHPNVERMGLLGAEVRPVEFGTKTLKEATSEAIRDWITNVETTHYLIGSCVGPEPVPGDRPRAPGGDRARGARAGARGRGPPPRRGDRLRRRRLERDRDVRRLPRRRRTSGSTASRPPAPRASAPAGRASSTARARSLLADEDGQITDAHSISAGLDYPGVGPEHAYLRDTGRVEYLAATDDEALEAFRRLAETEGIIPALEPLARARPRLRARRRRDRRLPLRPRRQGSGRGPRRTCSRLTHRVRARPTLARGRSAPTSPSCAVADGDTIETCASTPAARDRTGEHITDGGNPQTGPFFVEGAEPGDTLGSHASTGSAEPRDAGSPAALVAATRRRPLRPPARRRRASSTSGARPRARDARIEEPPAGLE